ncbi:hypothetical protein GBA52_004351 [Prunus armeniaca]|nr:hypothetical protein GBA52_004351 [Prunus armeniaca]
MEDDRNKALRLLFQNSSVVRQNHDPARLSSPALQSPSANSPIEFNPQNDL